MLPLALEELSVVPLKFSTAASLALIKLASILAVSVLLRPVCLLVVHVLAFVNLFLGNSNTFSVLLAIKNFPEIDIALGWDNMKVLLADEGLHIELRVYGLIVPQIIIILVLLRYLKKPIRQHRVCFLTRR